VWWDDLWLNESFAEYMGNRVTAEVTQYTDAWTHNAYARRQWGLVADQRPSTHPVAGNGADDASTALQNFDGISYSKGSSILKQLAATIGDDVFIRGAIDHFTTHRFGNATMSDLIGSWERAGAADLSGFTDNWLRAAGPDTLSYDRAAGVVRRTAPPEHPAGRTHTLRIAVATPGAPWRIETTTVDQPQTTYDAPPGAAVVLDPYEDTWALTQPDETTADALAALLPRTDDGLLRAGIWNGVRSAFHNAALDPEQVLSLIEAAIPAEDNDDAVDCTMPWAIGKVAPLSNDRDDALARIHRASRALLRTAPADSTLQLAAYQTAVSSSSDIDELRSWLADASVPRGVTIDLDLRWRILVRLAVLGGTDRDELRGALEAEPTAKSRVEHTRAVASLPDADAKAWAWRRFAGADDVPNYELQAAGVGMWQPGQEPLTDPYVERYFDQLPRTVDVRSGWVLADAAEWFFPMTALSRSTLDRCHALIASDGLEASLRRTVVDLADELARRLAIREKLTRDPREVDARSARS